MLDDRGFLTGIRADGATFVGPAVLVPQSAVDFSGTVWDTAGGGFEAIVWEIDQARPGVIGAVGIENCSFRGCVFALCGIGLSGAQVAAFARAVEIR